MPWSKGITSRRCSVVLLRMATRPLFVLDMHIGGSLAGPLHTLGARFKEGFTMLHGIKKKENIWLVRVMEIMLTKKL